ncbi:MAG: hypothetical protein OEZ39_01340 [Gammaproteobacteria bacterium]|nr:hypothetical protein [Gammaproteobacteria bacterium]MDH5650496.1 hypothetical protein [Gammaproteobacteria bacterium]
MNILPFEQFQLVSDKQPDAVAGLIRENCAPGGVFGFAGEHKPLLGTYADRSFKLCRHISYRNSFLPVATGRIKAQDNGSVIDVSLRMHMAVIVFMAVWSAFFLYGTVATIYMSFSGMDTLNPVVIGLFLFGYLLMQGGFWFEAAKIRKLLAEIITVSDRHH